MRIAITGADGFLGRNLSRHLAERGYADVVEVTRNTPTAELSRRLSDVGFVFHLAGVNRPKDISGFEENEGFTAALVEALGDRSVPVAFSSSIQAALDNPYGRSKRAAEDALLEHGRRTGAPVYLFRLANVFGKWSRPNYNSAVATFCHNVARGLPITVNDPDAPLRLIYVDDVVAAFFALLDTPAAEPGLREAGPVHETTVGTLAAMVREIRQSRRSLVTPPVGEGLWRALHATYLSFLPPEDFAYDVPVHADSRGLFIEMLKTGHSGQLSVFTAGPGITRGGHYHHTKTEKFLVVSGLARFGFRNLDTGETAEIVVEGRGGRIVETVPGWAHDVTNVGTSELVCVLWANEIFDRERPDTVAAQVLA